MTINFHNRWTSRGSETNNLLREMLRGPVFHVEAVRSALQTKLHRRRDFQRLQRDGVRRGILNTFLSLNFSLVR